MCIECHREKSDGRVLKETTEETSDELDSREALINALIPRRLYVVREVLEYEKVALAGGQCRRTVELTI